MGNLLTKEKTVEMPKKRRRFSEVPDVTHSLNDRSVIG